MSDSPEFRCQVVCSSSGTMPVTVGLPWPRGAIRDDRLFTLSTGQPFQTRVLDRWGDGSIRWCVFDFVAGPHEIVVNSSPRDDKKLTIAWDDEPIKSMLTSFDPTAKLTTWNRVETGPIRDRYQFHIESNWPVDIHGFVDRYLPKSLVKISITLTNRLAADHPNGNWDLGNGGSVTLNDFVLSLKRTNTNNVHFSVTADGPVQSTQTLRLHQASSGGQNWQSTNHLDRKREIPMPFLGYRLETNAGIVAGDRATPFVTDGELGVAMPEFWEQFPKQLEATTNEFRLKLFNEMTELQGGEQKTHEFWVATGPDAATIEMMANCRTPVIARATPEWYSTTQAIPYLTPSTGDPHRDYLSLVQQALDGPDTFVTKREAIDEYGWRHFGDIYGDHEAVKHDGPTPMISHYNNQYDCVQAFLAQFMRSGDSRWWQQGLQCANHTCDIDIYHTTGDKAAYNGGLFWHTYHYVDADTGTHRSYPKSLRKGPNVNQTERIDQLAKTAEKLQKAYAVGGGPSASHNYNTGLATAYFMTGHPMYRETAIDLAEFIIRMEDPASTPFRFLSQEKTGLATDSGGGGYHGPGRASANSIAALVTGHRLTNDAKYLAKAEDLIRRVCSPKQNLDRLDLLNAELRWFYIMHLQSLGYYLDHKAEIGQLDQSYAYSRETLLHYARWMATHERPILDQPERLQFPTETWAAQDLRKVEVFHFAAKHATGAEKEKFLERAAWFFEKSVNKLHTFPTKSLCRPVILAMKYGWSRNWWRQNPHASAPAKSLDGQVPEWQMFVPQRQIAVKRAKMIILAGGVVFAFVVFGVGLKWLLG